MIAFVLLISFVASEGSSSSVKSENAKPAEISGVPKFGMKELLARDGRIVAAFGNQFESNKCHPVKILH